MLKHRHKHKPMLTTLSGLLTYLKESSWRNRLGRRLRRTDSL